MNKDKMIRGLLFEGNVALTAITGVGIVNAAKEAHELSRVCTAALGRTLLMTAIMSCSLKNSDDALTCIISGGGPAGNIVCSAREGYLVKGYIENPELELPLRDDGKLDVAQAVGSDGTITVVRRFANGEQYVGKCVLASGEIADDFTNYYYKSEQTPSLIYLGVRVEAATGKVLSAGGLMLSPLPGCPDDIIDKIQNAASSITTLSSRLENESLDDCLSGLFSDMDYHVLEKITPEFSCDCSRERLHKVLIALGADELSDMAENDHGAELTCHFCNTKYRFTEEELIKLKEEALSTHTDE